MKEYAVIFSHAAYWHFEASGTKCPHTIDRWIDSKKSAAEEHDRNRGHEAEWARPSRLPRAKVLK